MTKELHKMIGQDRDELKLSSAFNKLSTRVFQFAFLYSTSELVEQLKRQNEKTCNLKYFEILQSSSPIKYLSSVALSKHMAFLECI